MHTQVIAVKEVKFIAIILIKICMKMTIFIVSYEQPIETVDLSADHDVSKASVISIASNSSSL